MCHLDLNLVVFLHSEIAKFEEILKDYKRYKDLLFKLSPPEWQEAQKAKALKAKVPSNKETQDQQKGKSDEASIRNGKSFIVIISIMVSNVSIITQDYQWSHLKHKMCTDLETEVSGPCEELPSIGESRLPSAHQDTA